MTQLRHAWILALALALGGCGTTTTHRVLTGAPGAPHGGPVTIIMENAPVPWVVEEVAIVQAVGNGMQADLEHVIDGLKREAQALGCTVIVRVHVDQGSATASATGVAGRVSTPAQ
jgi:hypothetical protein